MTNLKKFNKIRRIGHDETKGVLSGDGPLTIKEKVDGANCRFSVNFDEERIIFGTRNTVISNEKDMPKAFRHAVEYVRERTSIEDLREILPEPENDQHNIVFFGEAMHQHTIEYADTHGTEIGWKGVPSFIGFDVWCDQCGFMTTDLAEDYFNQMGIPFINVIDQIDPSDFMDEYGTDYVPDSAYYDGPAEGIVIQNEGNQTKAKVVTEQFAEKHGSAKSGGSQPTDDGTFEVVETYCTEARIDKQINKLLDRDGTSLDRSLMSELPVAVTEDIIEEEAHELATSSLTVDFKQLRSLIASGKNNTDCLSRIDDRMAGSHDPSDRSSPPDSSNHEQSEEQAMPDTNSASQQGATA